MSDTFWRGAVNRRAKNLALMKPFFELEANKGQSEGMRDYDMHLLCSVLMEAIIAEMGGAAGGAPSVRCATGSHSWRSSTATGSWGR